MSRGGWSKGLKLTLTHRINMSKARKNGKFAGKNNPNWRGGISRSSKYKTIIFYKNSPPYRMRIREHRLIMENYIGRNLKDKEIVHHKNGDTRDNRIENLKILSNSEHSRLHQTGRKLSKETKLKIKRARALSIERLRKQNMAVAEGPKPSGQ